MKFRYGTDSNGNAINIFEYKDLSTSINEEDFVSQPFQLTTDGLPEKTYVFDIVGEYIAFLGDDNFIIVSSEKSYTSDISYNNSVVKNVTFVSGIVEIKITNLFNMVTLYSEKYGALLGTSNIFGNLDPTITLIGSNSIKHTIGTPYVDFGAVSSTNSIVNIDSSAVNTSVAGTYKVIYTTTDALDRSALSIERDVEVVSESNTNAPVITITGNDIVIEKLSTYEDEGATAIDNYDGDITHLIKITNTVNPNIVGQYTVTYNVTNTAGISTSISRNVTVSDTTGPVIFLNGVNPTIHELSTSYIDAGVTIDDGEVVPDLSTLDANTIGTYTITYTATDSNGNISTATRDIIVQDTVQPIITLLGKSEMYIVENTTWNDPGSITDSGDIVTVSGTVNTNVRGVYELVYSSTDSTGNKADSVIRVVYVISAQKTQEEVDTIIGNGGFIDLSYMNLSGLDISSRILSDVDFSGSDLSYTRLSGTTVNDVNFTNANLYQTDLTYFKLNSGIFTNAKTANITITQEPLFPPISSDLYDNDSFMIFPVADGILGVFNGHDLTEYNAQSNELFLSYYNVGSSNNSIQTKSFMDNLPYEIPTLTKSSKIIYNISTNFEAKNHIAYLIGYLRSKSESNPISYTIVVPTYVTEQFDGSVIPSNIAHNILINDRYDMIPYIDNASKEQIRPFYTGYIPMDIHNHDENPITPRSYRFTRFTNESAVDTYQDGTKLGITVYKNIDNILTFDTLFYNSTLYIYDSSDGYKYSGNINQYDGTRTISQSNLDGLIPGDNYYGLILRTTGEWYKINVTVEAEIPKHDEQIAKNVTTGSGVFFKEHVIRRDLGTTFYSISSFETDFAPYYERYEAERGSTIYYITLNLGTDSNENSNWSWGEVSYVDEKYAYIYNEDADALDIPDEFSKVNIMLFFTTC
jgi:hypothetical protein